MPPIGISMRAFSIFVFGLGVWCFIAGTSTSHAAICAPSILWQQSFGGSGYELAGPIEPTAAGGFVVAASSNSEPGGNKSSPNFGSDDFWLLSLDATGSKLWERTLGGSGQDIFTSLCKVADGGYLVAGASQSPADGNKETLLEGGSDFWIIRLDPNGNKLWERAYGGPGHQAATQVIATSDGGFLLVGLVANSEVYGRYDVWLVKTDANGDKQWDRYLGGSEDEWPSAVIQTADGGYLVPVDSNSPVSGNKTAPDRGFHDIWLVRLDASGEILWQQTYGGDNADYPGRIIEQADGTLLLASTSFSTPSGNKTSPNYGLDDIWLLKLSAAGGKIWERSYGGSGEDSVGDMSPMPDGGLLIAGSSGSRDGHRSAPYYGESDYWLLRLAADGAVMWDKSFGGDSYEFSSTLRRTMDGGFLVSGTSYSEISGNKTNAFFGGIDLWMLKLSPENEGSCDSDGDGVADDRDQCPDSARGAVVNRQGCSIDQLVPCEGPWRNHGAYVNAVIKTVVEFKRAKLISRRQAIAIISQAARSDCGKKPRRR